MKMSQFRPVLQRNLPKHNSNLRVKKPGARIKLAFQEIYFLTTYNHIQRGGAVRLCEVR